MRRLRVLSEVECYLRCYGAGDESVRVVRIEKPPVLRQIRFDGEDLRRLFELRLDEREPEAA